MAVKVAKFGGSSLCDASQFRKVAEIIRLDPDRRFVVPSAPGKRDPKDVKVTDLLYRCGRCKEDNAKFEAVFEKVRERYNGIKEELGLAIDMDAPIDEVKRRILEGASKDYIASRGEYLNGLLLADYLGYAFVDAAKVVYFQEDGRLDDKKTAKAMKDVLRKKENAVIPGFYGSGPRGEIRTFTRGGSDVTGSLVTRGVEADLYENWTDVSGFMKADPRIVKDAKVIKILSYAELRELSYMGASVLHEDSIFPVREAGIPINVRNTNRPQDKGTLIVPYIPEGIVVDEITGIAGKKGFTVIAIEKDMMNAELGFVRRVLSVLEEMEVSFEHMPTGIDSLSLVIADDQLKGKTDDLIARITERCRPDKLEVNENMALIATVGHGMSYSVGIAARLFRALAKANINIRMIDQGSSEMNIIVGVENDNFEASIAAIYYAFA